MKCPKCNTKNPNTLKFCGECGTQLPSLEDVGVTETLETPKEELTTGSTFAGRYQIIEELGKGGMGKVYKVQDTKINEKIALKLIKPEIAKDKKTIERFSNELKFARKIRHKNICQMFDLGEERGTLFITMEYVEGQDLKKLIRQSGQLAIGTTINIAKQVCNGLIEAHSSGVIHRDLKPSNVMIDADGNARIMDFGIARSLRAKGITGAGVIIGTPEYMSPEQVDGEEADQRSDIYSLGVILYEMVTGRVPFEGDTPFSIGVKQKSEAPRPPKEINDQIPDDLNSVILKCMEKDKEKRYQGVEELQSELKSLEKGIPTTERIVSDRKPLTSREITITLGLKKLFLPALVIIAFVIIGLILWQVLPNKKISQLTPSDKPSLAVMYFENRTNEPDLDKILVDMLTTNLSRYESIEVVSSQRLFDILKQVGRQDTESIDKNMATEVATRAGVKTMLLGSIIKIGNKIRITSHLTSVQDGTIIGSEQVEGNKIDDIFDLVDELTAKVGNKLDISSEKNNQRFRIADATTDSFEAYKYYQKGLESFNRLNRSEAKNNMKRAIEIDPTFAMAYLYLAMISDPFASIDPFADITEIRKTLDLAEKYAYKVTDKERLSINIAMSLYHRDFELAFNLAKKLGEEYPKYKQGFGMLSFLGWFTGNSEVSINACERMLEMDPTDGATYNALAYSHSFSGNHPEAVSAFRKYKTLLPDDWNTYDSGWEIFMRAGRFDEAINICEEGLKRNPQWHFLHRHIGYSLFFKGDLDEARDKFRLYVDLVPTATIWGMRDIGFSYLFEGRYEKAQIELEKAVELAQKENDAEAEMHSRFNLGKMLTIQKKYDRAIEEYTKAEKLSWRIYEKDFNPVPIVMEYSIGIALAGRGENDEAKIRAEKINHIIQERDFDSLFMDFFYLLLSEVHIAQGNTKEAMANLHQVSGVTKLYSPYYRKLLSSASMSNGDFEKAINTYLDLYGSVTLRSYGMGDYFYFIRECSLVHYKIAKVYEKTMATEKAIEHYEKFLSLWKEADPGIAEVKDAKKRLAGLKSQ